MNEYAVLIEGFEHLSYPLGNDEAADKKIFSYRKERYIMHSVPSELSAEMALGASDHLERHASVPVGYVSDGKGGFYLVCRLKGSKPSEIEMAPGEKERVARLAMLRLSALHAEGLGCGGLSPEAIEIHGSSALVLDPSSIFAESGPEAHFFEAASTLCSLAGRGYAKRAGLVSLATAYLSSSPASREAVRSFMGRKGVSDSPAQALAGTAEKYLGYF